MSEMAHAGEHHGKAVLVGSGDDFGVAQAPAGLNDRFRACFRDDIESIAERKKRVGGHYRVSKCEAGVLRLDRGDASGIDTAHLPGAHAEGHAILAEHNGIGLDEFRYAPGKQQILQLLI